MKSFTMYRNELYNKFKKDIKKYDNKLIIRKIFREFAKIEDKFNIYIKNITGRINDYDGEDFLIEYLEQLLKIEDFWRCNYINSAVSCLIDVPLSKEKKYEILKFYFNIEDYEILLANIYIKIKNDSKEYI